jgi:hypothetical protein
MKADGSSWQRQPFTDGVPIPCSLSLTPAEFEQVKKGFVPQEMEDKWFIYYEAPYLFFHRSWTGQPVYRLRFTDGCNDQALLSADLANRTEFSAEYEGTLIDWLVSNLLLGKDKPFPTPRDISTNVAVVYRHHISGTALPEAPVRARTPRWRRSLDSIRSLLGAKKQPETQQSGAPTTAAEVTPLQNESQSSAARQPSSLHHESRLHVTPTGVVLEVVFHGNHHWRYGNEIAAIIQSRVEQESPRAIVLNFLDYEYSFGNDMGGPIVNALLTQSIRSARAGGDLSRPVCIVAAGETRPALESLFQGMAGLSRTLPVKFVATLDEAIAQLK